MSVRPTFLSPASPILAFLVFHEDFPDRAVLLWALSNRVGLIVANGSWRAVEGSAFPLVQVWSCQG